MASGSSSFQPVIDKLTAYKKKHYLNMLLKGVIFSIGILSSAYIAFNVLEFYGRFNTPVRVVFFFTFVSISVFVIVKWIAKPVSRLLSLKSQMSDEDAAVQIGKFFPEIGDKLLNTLQLKNLSREENSLLEASIAQKTKEFSVIPFTNAVNYSENKKRARFLAVPFAAILLILLFVPQLFVESTTRIINYNKEFAYPAPFEFLVTNKSLKAFKNEDFELSLKLNGNTIPENVYLVSNGKRSKMKKDALGEFLFDFKSLQRSEDFYFEAAGYNSKSYRLDVVSRPDLRAFEAYLKYPSYLNKKDESFKNAGNLTVPEGTTINWEFEASDADRLLLRFSGDSSKIITLLPDFNSFNYSKKVKKAENYELELANKFSSNKEKISYFINVIPDEFPKINVEQFKDTVLFNYISLGGNISDDYGLSGLRIFYRIVNKDSDKDGNYLSQAIGIQKSSANQNFIYNWKVDSLNLKAGDNVEYFLQVWDNDGVNGSKSSRTGTFEFHLPTEEEIKDQISEASEGAENKLDETLKKTKELQNDISKLENRLKTKNNLNWQDKKMLEEVMKKHEDLKKQIDDLKKQNETLNDKKEKFKNLDPEMLKKMEELQKLMDNLLDEETKKLFEELNKLLQQQDNKQEIQKVLEQLKKDENLEQELERAMEMFKELQFEQKLNETINDLKKLSEDQKKLSEKTTDQKAGNEKLQEEQKQLNEKFEDIKKEMKEMKNINESLENKKEMEETGSDEKQIEEDMQNSSDQLNKNQNKKAGSSQKDASKKMQDLAEKMQKMQESNESEQAQENIDDLRDILENLIQLSFDQEELMKDFRKVNQSDPRYITLSQKQLKLVDDSKIIEDSLLALAKRVFQIQSFVTREVGEMKGNMEDAMEGLKARRTDIATGKQQFAMTSMNNLALMLNDALKQMQQQMADAQQCKGGSCKKPGGKKPKPKPGQGMGEMQKQLNAQIEQLKKSGKTGKELSQELAKLAAQQEMIRNMLKELSKQPGGNKPGSELNKLQQQMEETEKDLVNKQLSQEMMNRQKDIMTRLLEAEKAAREQGEEEKREAEKAKEHKNEVPPSFEKYLKAREKEVDLLKTIPPALTPYYKQEVNEYFQKIEK